MLFNSLIFLLLFLPICLGGWYFIKNTNVRLFWLTSASFIFYGFIDWRFVLLMFSTIVVDYFCGKKIAASIESDRPGAKRWLILSISFNLLILGFFKYFNFFIDNLYSVLPASLLTSKPILNIVLPAGISFYTLSSMSYAIDLYQGKAKPVVSFLHFSTYISMFPHLIAGPIVRYRLIDEQLKNIDKPVDYANIYNGIFLFCTGLFRKIFIADFFALNANWYFDQYQYHHNGLIQAWVGVLSFTLQIYFDFSAYSEMAVGLGLMLGIRFPNNFDSPYKAVNFSDFWRRWHISLSTWLNDYLYTPISIARRNWGVWGVLFAINATFLIAGLWHGANWNFVLFGALNGIALSYDALTRKIRKKISAHVPAFGYKMVSILITFLCWAIMLVFFRSENMHIALGTLKSCLGLNGIESYRPTYHSMGLNLPQFIYNLGGVKQFIGVLVGILVVNIIPNASKINYPKSKLAAILLALILFVCIINITKPSPFLYFKF